MAVNGHRIVAAMQDSAHERFAQTFGNVTSANRNVEGAGVAVKVFEAFGHASKDVEVFGIEEAAFGPAMGRDGGDAAFERQSENPRIGVFSANNGNCMLAAGVSQERKFGF